MKKEDFATLFAWHVPDLWVVACFVGNESSLIGLYRGVGPWQMSLAGSHQQELLVLVGLTPH